MSITPKIRMASIITIQPAALSIHLVYCWFAFFNLPVLYIYTSTPTYHCLNLFVTPYIYKEEQTISEV
jgi:hypothetical protein